MNHFMTHDIFLLQLLKAWGGYVVTTCSTDAVPLVQSVGADEVIDYKTQNITEVLRNMDK